MPSFTSWFHLPHLGGAEHAAREKVVADEKRHLQQEKTRKLMEHQKRGASPSNDGDDDDDNNENIRDEDEDLEVL